MTGEGNRLLQQQALSSPQLLKKKKKTAAHSHSYHTLQVRNPSSPIRLSKAVGVFLNLLLKILVFLSSLH